MKARFKIKYTIIEFLIIIFIIIFAMMLYFTFLEIKIGTNNYKIYTQVINVNDYNDIKNKDLNQFISLEKVEFENPISRDDYNKITNAYPNIEIDAILKEKIYDTEFLNTSSYLDLSNIKIDNTLDSYFNLFPNLEKVKINSDNLTYEEIYNLITNNSNIIFDFDIKINNKTYNSLIESMDLTDENICDINEFKQKLSLFKYLKTLDMSNTNLSNNTLGTLREEFPNIKIDWILHYSVWSWRTDAKAFSVLITNFSYIPFESEDLEIFKYCTELQALDLGHQKITDISAIGKYLPNLRVLILADNDISDISPLTNLTHLHYLELFLNKITDITPLDSLHELVDLNLANNYKLKDVSILENKTELERLWINRCNISQADYNTLIKKLSNTEVSIVGMGSTDYGWRTHERYYKMISMYKNNYIDEAFTKYDK